MDVINVTVHVTVVTYDVIPVSVLPDSSGVSTHALPHYRRKGQLPAANLIGGRIDGCFRD
jgi:hypothetical protein